MDDVGRAWAPATFVWFLMGYTELQKVLGFLCEPAPAAALVAELRPLALGEPEFFELDRVELAMLLVGQFPTDVGMQHQNALDNMALRGAARYLKRQWPWELCPAWPPAARHKLYRALAKRLLGTVAARDVDRDGDAG